MSNNDVTRYELTQDNADPTTAMYDINKNHVGAADMIMHTNLGSSGFTSAWALISFPEDKLLIEQIQSDYPVLLDRTFNRMPPSKKAYSDFTYIHESGARFGMNYHEDGGVYITLKSTADVPADDPDNAIYNEYTEGEEVDVMPPDEFNSYSEKASEWDKASRDYRATEEEKMEAYSKASAIYRERAKEIRSRLDSRKLTPKGLSSLRKNYSESELADVKRHVDIISQNYPYLVVINALKTAQRMDAEFIYLLKDGGSSIQNIKKRKKIYLDMPKDLGATDDHIMGISFFKIPATSESIAKVKEMMPIKKSHDYDYSLMPSQNKAIISKRKEEQRRDQKSEREKRDIQLEYNQILPVLEMFEEAGVRPPQAEVDELKANSTVGNLLKFLGKHKKELRAAGVSKKKINQIQAEVARLRLAEIIESLGLNKIGMNKVLPLYSMLISRELEKEAEELYSIFEKTYGDNNLLLRESLI